MLYVEARYFVFFLVAFLVTWALRTNRSRKLWLLATSYLFYAGWDWRFLGLIWVSTLVDLAAGRRIHESPDDAGRKRWLLVSLILNLGLLGVFKYFDFFAQSAMDFSAWLGLPLSLPTLGVILPVGISFYTFQTLSYSIDIYRRRLEPTDEPLDLALFVAFFPQLVAGPIVRAAEFLPQLRERRLFRDVRVRAMLVLFLAGFVKKAVISDNLVPRIDEYFASPELFDAASAWLGTMFFAVQIYCDFSGYSDMAIASAGLLGYHLPLNFRQPYFSSNPSEFWGRWHITLSSWLRDYLFIPLGGSRGGRWKTQRNLLITMFLCGLWHGASWNFVVGGVMHGAALMVHAELRRTGVLDRIPRRPRALLGWAVTFWWVSVIWVFFRAESWADGWTTFVAFVTFQSPGPQNIGAWGLWVLLPLAFADWLAFNGTLARAWERLPPWAFPLVFGVAVAIALSLVPTKYTSFVYFQF